MKGKSTISVIFVIMLLVGACTNNTKTDNDLKGNVKSIKTSSYNVEERFGRYEKDIRLTVRVNGHQYEYESPDYLSSPLYPEE